MSDIKHVTKRRYGEQLLKLLNGGSYTPDSKITLRQAMLAVAQSRDKLARDTMWQLKNYDDCHDIYAQFLVDYQAETKEMPNGRKGVYIPLKWRAINLINNEGIHEVFFTEDETDYDNQLVPLPTGFNSLYRGIYDLEGHIGYIPEKNRLVLVGYDTPGAKITVKMVASSVDMDEYDMFPLPGDMEYDMQAMALELLGVPKNAAQDIINDNVDQPQVAARQR